jgi:hypothetical protein
MAERAVTVRDMSSGEQRKVHADTVSEDISKLLGH